MLLRIIYINKYEQFEKSKLYKWKYSIKKVLVKLVNCLYFWAFKKRWAVLKTKLRVFLKQTEPRILINKGKIIKTIEDRIIRDIRNLFEQEGERYHKPVRMGNFWYSNYMKYEGNGDRNKTL